MQHYHNYGFTYNYFIFIFKSAKGRQNIKVHAKYAAFKQGLP